MVQGPTRVAVAMLASVSLVLAGCADEEATDASYAEAVGELCREGSPLADLFEVFDESALAALDENDPMEILPDDEAARAADDAAQQLADAIDAAGVPEGSEPAQRGEEVAQDLRDHGRLLAESVDTGSEEARFEASFALLDAMFEVVEISKEVGVEECGEGIDADAQATYQLGEGNLLAGAFVEGFAGLEVTPGRIATEEESRCLGLGVVDELGTAQLIGLAQDGDAAFDYAGGDMIELTIDCVAGYEDQLRSDFVAEMTGVGMPPEVATCVLDSLLDGQGWEGVLEHDYEADPGPMEDAVAGCT